MRALGAPAARTNSWLRRLFAALVIACTGVASSAQELQVVRDDADERLIACLQPDQAALPPMAYPADALLLKMDATVRVRLTFTQPDAPPAAVVFFNSGDDRFSEVVLQRVKAYRLPCLPNGRSPITTTQEFYFDPRDGRPVVWNAPRPGMSAGPPNKCTHQAMGKIDYPSRALEQDSTRSTISRKLQSGVVLVHMQALSEGAPSSVIILSDAGSGLLAGTVTEYLQNMRVSCDRYPVKMLQAFQFHIEGEKQYAFKDMSLKSFAGLLQDLDGQRVRFDFSTMRCPFDVQLTLYQPHFPNSVGEVGEADPNRAEFLEWLRGVTLRLPRDAAKHLVGSQMRVSVPCGLLDLRE